MSALIADIQALAASLPDRIGGALVITERIQTSGRDAPEPPRGGEAARRAQRRLGRLYATAGESRRQALTLWLVYSGTVAIDQLTLALAVLVAQPDRIAIALEWSRWGEGSRARTLMARADVLLLGAIRAYAAFDSDKDSDREGCSGALGQMVADADQRLSSVRQLPEVVAEVRARKRATKAKRSKKARRRLTKSKRAIKVTNVLGGVPVRNG